ncbi:MAG: hypothetical protein IT307_06865 [Chloroflexi bacterium]|nr:hypothetical protein [Chloroflexota bacterium]
MADSTAEDSGQEWPVATDPVLAMVFRKILGGEIGLTQVWFNPGVLDRYRGQSAYRVVRTDSAGRVRAAASWTLDFGIVDGDQLIHASVADLAQRLPPPERQHWISFLVTPPVSRVFLTMRSGAGSCMDDGEIRDW